MEQNNIEHMAAQQEAKTESPWMSQIKNVNKKVAFSILGVLVVAGLAYSFKSLFIAATVNGSPISRWSVVRESEKQSGRDVLENMINQKIIEAELNKSGVSATSEEIDGEVKKISDRIASQGGTLLQALAMQGMTEDQLRVQLSIQKRLEKLLADKTQVSDADIDAYIKQNKLTQPKDVKKEDFRAQIKEDIQQNKFQQAAQAWVADITAKANINYFVTY